MKIESEPITECTDNDEQLSDSADNEKNGISHTESEPIKVASASDLSDAHDEQHFECADIENNAMIIDEFSIKLESESSGGSEILPITISSSSDGENILMDTRTKLNQMSAANSSSNKLKLKRGAKKRKLMDKCTKSDELSAANLFANRLKQKRGAKKRKIQKLKKKEKNHSKSKIPVYNVMQDHRNIMEFQRAQEIAERNKVANEYILDVVLKLKMEKKALQERVILLQGNTIVKNLVLKYVI